MKIYDKFFFLKSDLNFPSNTFKITPKKSAAEKLLLEEEVFKIFKQKPKKIKILKPSSLNRVYEFQINDNLYIFKLSLVNKIYSEISFQKESEIEKLFLKNKLPHLKILISRDNSFISEKAEGISFYKLFADKKLLKIHLYKFGEFVGKVHKIKEGKLSWQNNFQINLEQQITECLNLGLIDKIQYRKAMHFFKTFKIPLKTPSLIHGDLANHNVFIKNKEITALIDWEDSMYGDPIYDLAFYAAGIYQKHNRQWLNFLEGYKSVQNKVLDKNFDYRFWGYFLRISLIKAIVRSKFRTANVSDLPDVKSRISLSFKKIEKF